MFQKSLHNFKKKPSKHSHKFPSQLNLLLFLTSQRISIPFSLQGIYSLGTLIIFIPKRNRITIGSTFNLSYDFDFQHG